MIQQELTLDTIKQGESLTLSFTYTNKTTGAAIDMGDYTMTLTVKNDPAQTTADITKADASWDKTKASKENGGIMAITLSASDTTDLDPETYHLEAKAVYGASTIKTKKDIKLPVLMSIE